VTDSEGLSAPEMIRNAPRLTYRQLDYWTRVGWLKCQDRGPKAGSGAPRRYPFSQMILARRMLALINYGLKPSAAHEIATNHDELTAVMATLTHIEADLIEAVEA
jgi:DNA-binding transcriptional MerR regulator